MTKFKIGDQLDICIDYLHELTHINCTIVTKEVSKNYIKYGLYQNSYGLKWYLFNNSVVMSTVNNGMFDVRSIKYL